MADGVKIDLKKLIAFSETIGDTSTIERIYNNAFENMIEKLAVLSKKNHAFESRTFLLENSVLTEFKLNAGSVYVPEELVSYAGAIYDGYGPFEMHPFGNENVTVLHPGYKGDPFILNNWIQFADQLTQEFLMEFASNFEEYFRKRNV